MDTLKVKSSGTGKITLELNGVPMRGASSLRIHAAVNDVTKVKLEIIAPELEVDLPLELEGGIGEVLTLAGQ